MSSSKVTTKPLTLCSLYGTVPVEALDASRELLYAVSPASSSFRRDVIAFEPLRHSPNQPSMSVWRERIGSSTSSCNLRMLDRPVVNKGYNSLVRSCVDCEVSDNIEAFLALTDHRVQSEFILEGTIYTKLAGGVTARLYQTFKPLQGLIANPTSGGHLLGSGTFVLELEALETQDKGVATADAAMAGLSSTLAQIGVELTTSSPGIAAATPQ